MACTKQKVVASPVNGQAAPEKQHLNGSVLQVDADPVDLRTDLSRWRLLDERGRQTWHYLESDKEVEKWPQSIADRHHLGLSLVSFSTKVGACTRLIDFQI
jgi:hypothetical protein